MLPNNAEEQLAIGILSLAHELGVKSLSKTALMKLFYLADCYTAEETEGTPLTDWQWKFDSFGPHAPAASTVLSRLEKAGRLIVNRIQSQENGADKTANYYSSPAKFDITVAGVTCYVRERLVTDIRKFGQDLNGLLNYVYFETEPMRDAKPKEILSFLGCIKTTKEDLEPIGMKTLNQKDISAVREKLAQLAADRKQRQSVLFSSSHFDSKYESFMESLDDAEIEIGQKGIASINLK